jgi:hypothetical protein
MAEEIDKIARIFTLLESIDFAKVRNEFESISSWKKIAAGESAEDVAVDIVRQFVPHKAINADTLKLLTAVLQAIAEAAVISGPPLACCHLPAVRRDNELGPDNYGTGS